MPNTKSLLKKKFKVHPYITTDCDVHVHTNIWALNLIDTILTVKNWSWIRGPIFTETFCHLASQQKEKSF